MDSQSTPSVSSTNKDQCEANPDGRKHDYRSVMDDAMINHIQCWWCSKRTSHSNMGRFINHVTELNLSRLVSKMIHPDTKHTPAVKTLIEHVAEETM